MNNGSPIIIPIFLPHLGCRERCLFCNQRLMADGPPSLSSIRKFVEASLMEIPSNKKNRKKQVAFYGGSFTAIPEERQVRYLKAIRPFLDSGGIDSIRISTRPDAMSEETLSLLKAYGVRTIEIGAQSMIDEVLFLSLRGHRAEDTMVACSQARKWGFEVGLHLMIGLPGDTVNRFLQTLDQVTGLKPDFLRIHPALVLKGAPLEALWRAGRYAPLSLEDAVNWLKIGLLKLERSGIRVARIGLQPTEDLERHFLAGPYHPALHQLVDSEIALDMAEQLLRISTRRPEALFVCHPKEVSNLRGQRNGNMRKLKRRFQLQEITIQIREDMARGTLVLQNQRERISISRGECRG